MYVVSTTRTPQSVDWVCAVVGPPTEVIKKMGDKVAARRFAQSLAIPTVPGTEDSLKDLEEAYAFAER